MRLSILSVGLAALATVPNTLAAPATSNGAVSAAVPPAGPGTELHSATAIYDETHGPLTERELEARQTYNAKGWWWDDGETQCWGKDATYEKYSESIVWLSEYQLGDMRSCLRKVHIENQGVYATAKVVGVYRKFGRNDIGLPRGLMRNFTNGQPEKTDIKWYFGPPVHSPAEQAPHGPFDRQVLKPRN